MTTTVIDELIITIGLDPTKFNQGQQQSIKTLRQFEREATEAGKKTEDAAQRMVDGFSRVTKEVLGLGAAFLGVSGLKDLVVSTVSGASALNVLAKSYGIATEAANRYANATERSGGSSQAATSAMADIALRIQKFNMNAGGPDTLGEKFLQLIGLTSSGWDEHHPEQFVDAIHRGIKNTPGASDKAAAIAEGTGTGAFLPLLLQENYNKMLADSLTITEKEAKAAREVAAAFIEAQQAVTKMVNDLFLTQENAKSAIAVASAISAATRGDLTPAENVLDDANRQSAGLMATSVNSGFGYIGRQFDKTFGFGGWKRRTQPFGPEFSPESAGPPIPQGFNPFSGANSRWRPRLNSDAAYGLSTRDYIGGQIAGAGQPGAWVAPYLGVGGSQQAAPQGWEKGGGDDNSRKVHIEHLTVQAPAGADAHAFANTFMQAVTYQSESGAR